MTTASPVARWLGRELVMLGTVTSTNDEAAARARAGAPHGTVVVADAQTRGRGQKGHVWWSPPGDNLYLSAILRLDLPPPSLPPLTLATGVGVCDAVREVGADAHLKWPNDVLAGDPGRKIAGILTETSSRQHRIEFVVVGVGVNLNTAEFPSDLASIATSLRRELGAPQDRDAFLARLLLHLERWIDRFVTEGTPLCVEAWKDRTRFLGRRISVVSDGRLVSGLAVDVDDEGALWVAGDAGTRYRIISGEVSSNGEP